MAKTANVGISIGIKQGSNQMIVPKCSTARMHFFTKFQDLSYTF